MKNIVRQCLLWAACLSLVFGLSACDGASPVISAVTAEQTAVHPGGSVQVTCHASDPDGDTLEYVWTATGGTIASQSSLATWYAPDETGTFTVHVLVRDSGGNESGASLPLTVAADLPPRIESILTEPSPVGEGQQCFLRCRASDPESDPLTYVWEAEKGDLSGSGPVVSWKVPHGETSSVIRVTVSDPQGHTATMAVEVAILPNQSPVIDALTASPKKMIPGMDSIITCTASDPDDDALGYAWETTGGTLQGSGPEVTWMAPDECGGYIVTVTVTDGRQGEVVGQISLLVSATGG